MENNSNDINITNQAEESEKLETENASAEYSTRKQPFGIRAMFGLLIIILYFLMGYLCFVGYFFWVHPYASYGLGTIFTAYGLWRGYRYLRARF